MEKTRGGKERLVCRIRLIACCEATRRNQIRPAGVEIINSLLYADFRVARMPRNSAALSVIAPVCGERYVVVVQVQLSALAYRAALNRAFRAIFRPLCRN